MFTVPEGRTFWQAFSDHVTLFNKHTSHLGGRKLYFLTVDPVGMLNFTVFFLPSKRSRLDEVRGNHIKHSPIKFMLDMVSLLVDLYFKVLVVLFVVSLICLCVMCLSSAVYNLLSLLPQL